MYVYTICYTYMYMHKKIQWQHKHIITRKISMYIVFMYIYTCIRHVVHKHDYMYMYMERVWVC